ncbi:MAG: Clp protease N-terminal domain-containing protein [Streptosporangiaceae bacterium]
MTRRAGRGQNPISKRLLSAAGAEADRARHGYVGCEHLLLALLTDKDPTAMEILAANGIRLPAARAAVTDVISSGRGDGPRWNAADLLATLGVDLPAIQRQVRADYGPNAITDLYASPVGRRLPRGPLCGPQMAPGLRKALSGNESRASFPTSGHALLSLLDAGSGGLAAVLEALGSGTEPLRLAVRERLSQAG